MKTKVFITILILINLQVFAQKPLKKQQKIRKQMLIESPLTPSRAAFYSAVVPGLGQIYLGKAWKLPLVYGAIGASVYGYVYNRIFRTIFDCIFNNIIKDIIEMEFISLHH